MELVRRILAHEWREFRDLRLAALADSPDSFASAFDREAAYLDGEWQTRVAACAESSTQAVFVAECDGAWQGMVGVGPEFEVATESRLWGMWVAPAARGTAFAGALIAAACEFAREAGSVGIGLCVLTTNERAVRLYQRHEFVTLATAPFPDDKRPGTDYLMRRSLV
jgi:ribosomal protein S18 acetylase RimI-like enzyme